MKFDVERNLLAFDASKFNYGQITADSAPATWMVHRYDEKGESYALEDLEEFICPIVIASLALNSFAYESYAGRLLIERAQNLSVPTAVIAEETMRDKLVVFESVLFIPRISGQVSDNLKAWFSTL